MEMIRNKKVEAFILNRKYFVTFHGLLRSKQRIRERVALEYRANKIGTTEEFLNAWNYLEEQKLL